MSLLKIEGIGRLAGDPEVKQSASGNERLVATLPVNKQKNGEEVTYWLRLTAFDDRIKRSMGAAHKGSLVSVRGDFDPQIFQGNDGTSRMSLDVVVTEFDFLPSTRASGEDGQQFATAGARRGPARPVAEFDDDETPAF